MRVFFFFFFFERVGLSATNEKALEVAAVTGELLGGYIPHASLRRYI